MSFIRLKLINFLTICFLFLGLSPISKSVAHEIGIVDLSLHELESGRFLWTWEAATKPQSAAQTLKPQWPEGCHEEGAFLICAHGLRGHLMINGLGRNYGVVVLRINWREGEQTVQTLTVREAEVQLFGAARDERDFMVVAKTYFQLGIEHILTGLDHLSFVISLLFLVGFRRQLIWTISAFTLAHSFTLISSAMGWFNLRSPPVEATIALSIMLVASEALKQGKTLTREWPAPVAFTFGLVHGLGFAGALQEIGLPEAHLITALLTFNLGVEAGQLFVIFCAWIIVARLFSIFKFINYISFRRPILYSIGTIATYWALSRLIFL